MINETDFIAKKVGSITFGIMGPKFIKDTGALFPMSS